MKNQDYSFKLLVIVILAGVVLACAPATKATHDQANAVTTAQAADPAFPVKAHS